MSEERNTRASATPGRAAAIEGAAEGLNNFAWSCVRTDCEESLQYLSELRENLRKALALPSPAAERAPEAEPPARDAEGEPIALVDDIVREVAELPDRTSPEDYPDMMLVTAAELRRIIQNSLHSLEADDITKAIRIAAERGVALLSLR